MINYTFLKGYTRLKNGNIFHFKPHYHLIICLFNFFRKYVLLFTYNNFETKYLQIIPEVAVNNIYNNRFF